MNANTLLLLASGLRWKAEKLKLGKSVGSTDFKTSSSNENSTAY
jgi:hypothetical protein